MTATHPAIRTSESSDAKARLIAVAGEHYSNRPEPVRPVTVPVLPRLSSEELAERREAEQRQEAAREEGMRYRRWQSVAAAMGPRYSDCRLASFRTYGTPEQREDQARAISQCEEYVTNISDNVKRGNCVVLFGPPGTGKDHILAALIREACKQGLDVRWLNGLDFFGDMRDRIDSDSSESTLIRELGGPDILAISDPLPPWGPLTSFQAQTLFRVIDRRYRARKPIWVTMNVASGVEASDRLGAAVKDRLAERALSVHCNWPSYRTAEIRD